MGIGHATGSTMQCNCRATGAIITKPWRIPQESNSTATFDIRITTGSDAARMTEAPQPETAMLGKLAAATEVP
jgi:hypothetical protein